MDLRLVPQPPGVFADDISAALGRWTATNRVGFTRNDNDAEIIFIDDCATWPLLWYASTGHTNPYLIKLNRQYMDGHPAEDGTCPSGYPPHPNIHHAKGTITHEVGHALKIAHNAVDRVSLMWPDIDDYFVCGTEDLTANETNRLMALYPTLCGQ